MHLCSRLMERVGAEKPGKMRVAHKEELKKGPLIVSKYRRLCISNNIS